MVSKLIVKLLLIILIFVLSLSLSACNKAEATIEQTFLQSAESICDMTMERVGQNVKVIGEIKSIDREDSGGIYADLEEDRYHIGIWINREEWESWTDEEQALLDIGVKVVAEGELQSFEGNLVIDLSSPLVQAESSVSEAAQENEVTTPESMSVELNLVSEPLTEKRLSVEKVYSGGDGAGLCYLGSYAMIARFADGNIDFTDVISNCGIATSAFYVPEINLLLNGFEIGSIAVASENQGFDYYIAALEGANLTDTFLANNLVENAKQIISVGSEDSAFKFLQQLISSDIPAMVHLDINFIRGSLIDYCPYWEEIFSWQDTHMSSTHIDHYMVVTGYDQDFIYLNDPTEKQEDLGTDIPIAISDFLEAWKNGNHPSLADESRIGPYWMLFLGERGVAKSVSELISWNKDIATEAIPEIRQAAQDPNVSELIHCNGMYRARKEFGTFLRKDDFEEAGDIFIEISELFRNLCNSSDQQSDLLKIADLQEKSLAKW